VFLRRLRRALKSDLIWINVADGALRSSNNLARRRTLLPDYSLERSLESGRFAV